MGCMKSCCFYVFYKYLLILINMFRILLSKRRTNCHQFMQTRHQTTSQQMMRAREQAWLDLTFSLVYPLKGLFSSQLPLILIHMNSMLTPEHLSKHFSCGVVINLIIHKEKEDIILENGFSLKAKNCCMHWCHWGEIKDLTPADKWPNLSGTKKPGWAKKPPVK